MNALAHTGPQRNVAKADALSRSRKRQDLFVKTLCVGATAIGLAFLGLILFTLLTLGLGGLSLSVFTKPTLPPGSGGGLLNAIIGSLIQTAIGTAIGTPIGMLVGTYLSEYAGGSKLGDRHPHRGAHDRGYATADPGQPA